LLKSTSAASRVTGGTRTRIRIADGGFVSSLLDDVGRTAMASVYEEVEIEDMKFDAAAEMYTYPCPCGDKFSISLEELHDGEDIATCPSCTLRIRVIFDSDALPELRGPDQQQQ
jgi:diphthamide biosynthesis protein 3